MLQSKFVRLDFITVATVLSFRGVARATFTIAPFTSVAHWR
jgi:hypothetical protein